MAGILSSKPQELVICREGRQAVVSLMCCESTERFSDHLEAFGIFVFPLSEAGCACTSRHEDVAALHSQIVCRQTRSLGRHVEAFQRTFVVSNLFSHPLVKPADILLGHRLVSFAGTPVWRAQGKMIGTVCAVDIKERSWSDTEIKALKGIATQIANSQLC